MITKQFNNRLPVRTINQIDEMVNSTGIARVPMLIMLIESGHKAFKSGGLHLSGDYQREFINRLTEQGEATNE